MVSGVQIQKHFPGKVKLQEERYDQEKDGCKQLDPVQ